MALRQIPNVKKPLVTQFLIGLILITFGMALIICRGRTLDWLNSKVKGRFARWYLGVDDVWYDLPLQIKLLIFGGLFILAGVANVYWSIIY